MNWQLARSMTADEFDCCLKLLGMSRAAAARYLGLSQRQVYRIAHGQTPVPTTVVLLLNSLLNHKETTASQWC